MFREGWGGVGGELVPQRHGPDFPVGHVNSSAPHTTPSAEIVSPSPTKHLQHPGCLIGTVWKEGCIPGACPEGRALWGSSRI